jgi:hypothetical protein
MQLEVGRVGKVWAANCGFFWILTCGFGLRRFLTKNQGFHTQVRSNDGRVKCSTLMKTGATILGLLCKTTYTNLAVPQGVFAFNNFFNVADRVPIRRKISTNFYNLVEIGDKNRLKIRLKSALESEVTRSPQGP